jgi:ankyrin repeat protein
MWGGPEKLDDAVVVAADHGNLTEVRSLLKRGASPNGVNSEGSTLTALMSAARGGRANVVRALLEAGAKSGCVWAAWTGLCLSNLRRP